MMHNNNWNAKLLVQIFQEFKYNRWQRLAKHTPLQEILLLTQIQKHPFLLSARKTNSSRSTHAWSQIELFPVVCEIILISCHQHLLSQC